MDLICPCFKSNSDLEDHKVNNNREWPREFDISVPNKARQNYKFFKKNGVAESMVTNVVITSRYKWWNFLVLNLWDQFHEVSNIYFLFVGFLQVWGPISTTQGIPDIYIPLSFILTVSGVRAALDDYAKHKEDNARAAKPFLVYDPEYVKSHPNATKAKDGEIAPPTGFFYKPSGQLTCGDIIMINQNQVFPADILCIATSHRRGHCFVETASLDGETNLKIKESVACIHDNLPYKKVKEDEKDEKKRQRETYLAVSEASAPLRELKGKIEFGEPDKDLEKLRGTISVSLPESSDYKASDRDKRMDGYKLKGNNLLLRGTKLKNTAFIIGMVLYAGIDTKIRKNNEKKGGTTALKKSAIILKVNNLLLFMLALQLFLCFLGAVYSGVWQTDNSGAWYLDLSSSAATEACLRFFTWFIILSQLVPISLVVTAELTKKFQQLFMERDVNMWDDQKGPLKVNYGQISEDLGQVEYIFSDKTGTLTQNRMEFRLAFVGAKAYGSSETDIAKRVKLKEELAKNPEKKIRKIPWTERVKTFEKEMEAVGVDGLKFPEDIKKEMLGLMWGREGKSKDADLLRNYLTHMAISNTITPVSDGKNLVYNSSSPDELALCNFAKHLGFKFLSRSGAEGNAVVTVEQDRLGEKVNVQYRLQGVLPFDSVRKRVTAIYSDMDREYVWIMCKGADSCVEPLLNSSDKPGEAKKEKVLMDQMKSSLLEASNYGLRTLLVAESKKPFSWWEKHRSSFLKAKDLQPDGTMTKQQVKLQRRSMYKKIEVAAQLKLLGATAIEDQLQHLVPECIEDLLEGGVKVWMLTGDKRETAKNIAMACNLIEPDMIALKIPENIQAQGALEEFRINSAQALSENRLIEITGKWAKLKEDTKALEDLYYLIDQNHDGAIQKDELQLILGVLKIPNAIDMFSDFKTADKDTITLNEFIGLIRGTDIDMIKAIRADIKAGKARLNSITDLDRYPVSMVVEGGGENSALGKISEAPNSDMLARKDGSWLAKICPCFEKERKIELSKEELDQLLLKEEFFELASKCKSVVACRCTPLQKAWVVDEMRKRTGAVCLAIGDGGNDEPMIKKANVGVGIVGEEGSAAAQAADYAFGQFRFLHTLLFVHGSWSYERISVMVLYIFYKTAIAASIMFFFGFFSAFSGQQLFNAWIYTFYNAVFTAVPIIVVAVLDQGLSAEYLENLPKAYRSLISRGQLFGTRIFFRWVMSAVVHTAIIFFTAFWCLDTNAITFPDGKTHGLWMTSTTIYTIAIVMVSFRLTFEMRSITWIHHFFFWGSLAVFVLIAIGLNVLPSFNPDLYFVVFAMWANPQAWLTSILAGSLPLLLDLAIRGVKIELFPSYLDLLRERCHLNTIEEKKMDETYRFAKRHSRAQAKKHKQGIDKFKHKLNEATHRRISTHTAHKTQMEKVINTLLRWRDLTGAVLDATEEIGKTLHYDDPKAKGKNSLLEDKKGI
mmetsp:Transcript_12746/g.19092  ORF Transcript_12746/g.19092 Transcript_12746/m.19092 type:complete len:1460 (+) Transcript_12746:82-4461(+)